MKLEIGPGTAPLGGYETVDAFDHHNPTYCFDIIETDPWSIPDNRYEEVIAIHVLEHIEVRRLNRVFQNAYRVLAPGGTLRIHVPNGPVIASAYLEFPDKRFNDGICINNCVYGSEAQESSKYAFAHKILFDEELLFREFSKVGFRDIKNCTMDYEDRHDPYWAWMCAPVDRFSLKVYGVK